MKKYTIGIVFLISVIWSILLTSPVRGAACDADDSGAIDRNDISAIFAARSTPADSPDDPRDANGDGLITVKDSLICVLRCDLPRCEIVDQTNEPPIAVCDADDNGAIDRNDISAIFAARNTPADSPDDPRDANGDGLITVKDGLICVLRCDLPRCKIVVQTNEPPIADAGQDQNVLLGSTINLNGSESSDPDSGPAPLTYLWSFASVPPTSSITNSDIANADSAAPSFVPDVIGAYVLTLEVSDGDLSDSDQVQIMVERTNVAPNADAGPDRNVLLGNIAQLDGSQSYDPDSWPDPLSFQWTFSSLPPDCVLTDSNILNATTPYPYFSPDVTGTYLLSLEVSDGDLIDTDQVEVYAQPHNVPPNADAGPDQEVELGTIVLLDGSDSEDPDNGPGSLTFSWTIVSLPSESTLTQENILDADSPSPSFTPDAAGTYVFLLQVSDSDLNDSDQVMIVVSVPNHPPVSHADNYAIDEDTTLVDNVLANDTDEDGDALNAVLVASTMHGSLSLQSNGSFNYTPEQNYNGTDTFTYRANDGELESIETMVTITVNPVNDEPAANDDAYSMNEDGTLTINAGAGILVNDADIDGDALTAALVSDVSNGTLTLSADGSFSYTPNADFNGADNFTYTATDGTLTSNEATVTIMVNLVNDEPVANDDAYSVNEDGMLTIDAGAGILINDIDIDGDALTANLVSDVSNGTLTLNEDGSFSYTPHADFNGVDSFTYTATDGTLTSNEATVTITVDPVNDAPVANDDAYSANENEVLTVEAAAGVLINDTDIDGDTLNAILASTPQHGTLSLNGDGSFTYTPDNGFHGQDSFTYTTHDGAAASNEATVIITVAPASLTPPVLDPLPGATIFSSIQVCGTSRSDTTVRIEGGVRPVSIDLDANTERFCLDVPLRLNTENTLTASAIDNLTPAPKPVAYAQPVQIVHVDPSKVIISEVTARPLTTEEIEELVANGVINLDDPANFNVSMFTVVLTIGSQQVTISQPVAVSRTRGTVSFGGGGGWTSISGGGGGGFPSSGGGTPSRGSSAQLVVITTNDGQTIPGVIIIDGRIKTLKEFFQVTIALFNTTEMFTLADMNAGIVLPTGLTPIRAGIGSDVSDVSTDGPIDTVHIGVIGPGETGIGQFIIRGDEEGTHEIKVRFAGFLTGGGLPEPVPVSGAARTTVEVHGPPELSVVVRHPSDPSGPDVSENEIYPLIVEITNNSPFPAHYASLELFVGGGALLVDENGDPIPESDVIRDFGHIQPGRTVATSFWVQSLLEGEIIACQAITAENITLTVDTGPDGTACNIVIPPVLFPYRKICHLQSSASIHSIINAKYR